MIDGKAIKSKYMHIMYIPATKTIKLTVSRYHAITSFIMEKSKCTVLINRYVHNQQIMMKV